MSKETPLQKKIKELQQVSAGERDMYPYLRDLLTHKAFGIRLKPDQVVVDSSLGKKAGAPDLFVYASWGPKAIKTPDHVVAVFEAKPGSPLASAGREQAIFQEKRKYIQTGTRYFFLVDQDRVCRRHVEFDPHAAPETFLWADLQDPEQFQNCFGVISQRELTLEGMLEKFRQGNTRFAYRDIENFGRHRFVATIREVSQILQEAVNRVIADRVIGDLRQAEVLIKDMESRWLSRRLNWTGEDFEIEFARLQDEQAVEALEAEDIARYEEEHDRLLSALEPYLYVLRLEYQVLGEYADRLGVEEPPSFLKKGRENQKVIDSFVYETASLMVSRMLMIRFSEDHNFMQRHICNGGIQVFAHYADHFREGYQALLRQSYKTARNLYRGLFDRSILDWVLMGQEDVLSQALLRAMYLLSRWNFRTIKGDILSGVYDHYLDASKRRALGEVFTRPEIARYILERCGYGQGKVLLDPACGSGTFLVEALERDLVRLRQTGLLTLESARSLLKRLHGLDINPFSVSLAQIQVLWHLMELISQEGTKAREQAVELVQAINIEGGHSSLDPMGSTMGRAQQDLDFQVERARSSGRRVFSRQPPRFRRINRGAYDLVVGNPPYIRVHRRQMPEHIERAYQEVAFGQYDIYLLFIYRTLRSWLKEGGKMGFIVPLALLDAGYGEKLREVLRQYRILEIVDLELLGKKTFHGVKRPVIILIVENSPGSPEDEVELVTVLSECYEPDEDRVDMSRARREKVPRQALFQDTYLPRRQHLNGWGHLVEYADGEQAQWTTKVRPSDQPILNKLVACPRLGDIVPVVYKKQQHPQPIQVEAAIPAHENRALWKPYLLVGEGLKLGGGRAVAEQGRPLYKGQNIFVGGTLGAPMGYWDPAQGQAQALKLYLYEPLFDNSRLFAFRQIAAVPTACRVQDQAVFQNTAYLVQLNENFPLHYYCVSRVIQFVAAKLFRASVIEDLASTWYKKQIVLLPLPAQRDEALRTALMQAGDALVEADRYLADVDAKLDRVLAALPKRSLQDWLTVEDPRIEGLDLTALASGAPTPLAGLKEDGSSLRADDMLFRIEVPHEGLRRYLHYRLQRALKDDPTAAIARENMATLEVPEDLTPVLAEIEHIDHLNPAGQFEAALRVLDTVVGRALGLEDQEIDYIVDAMQQDAFLKKVRPMYEHRGLRVQAYADHEGQDRYN